MRGVPALDGGTTRGWAGRSLRPRGVLSDPESLLADLVSPEQRHISNALDALTTSIGAYVDQVTAGIAATLTSSPAALREAWYRYGVEDTKGEQALPASSGSMSARPSGPWGALHRRRGREGRRRRPGPLWANEDDLPTPAEVDAPACGWRASACWTDRPCGTIPRHRAIALLRRCSAAQRLFGPSSGSPGPLEARFSRSRQHDAVRGCGGTGGRAGEQHQRARTARGKASTTSGARSRTGRPSGGRPARVDHARMPDRVDEFRWSRLLRPRYRGHGTLLALRHGATAVSVPEPRLRGFPLP